MSSELNFKLTKYSHGAGCGCKISPAVLEQILNNSNITYDDPNLIIDGRFNDDAAVYNLGNDQMLISTTDFFMPIVDDPFDFGRIASANAISDVYAMGGHPIMAISILGWPINELPAEVASRVIDGCKSICKEAGIALAGGHSIDSPEPIFGLAVNGLAQRHEIKTNRGAQDGDFILMTKPIGLGILSTAAKREILKYEDYSISLKHMTTLNRIGEALGKIEGVSALTDITGFGLLGHLIEVCKASHVTAKLYSDDIPIITENINQYINEQAIPGGTHRNWKSYGHHVNTLQEKQQYLYSDPQTSGGLLVVVNPNTLREVQRLFEAFGHGDLRHPIGKITEYKDSDTLVKVV